MSLIDETEDQSAENFRLALSKKMVHGLHRSFASKAFDLLLPPVCVHCRKPTQVHGQLCAPCWQQIDFITPPLCDVTGLPLPFDTGGRQLSALALHNPPAYSRARARAHYNGTMRNLVHGLKYGDRRDGLPLFSRWLAEAGAELLIDADLLLPVPLYRTRLWRRRFNQAALLARQLSKLTGLPAPMMALNRRRATRSQVGLSQSQRQRNVAGAFVVPAKQRSMISGSNIVLVDDVLTTGATAEACAKTLLRAGTARVDILVLARVSHVDARLP